MPTSERSLLRARPLLIVLALQFVLVGALLYGVQRGWDFLPFIHPRPPAARPAAAGAVPRATADRFDARRAMRLARMQTDVGPRPAGSARLQALAERLRVRLPGGRFEPVGPGLRNIVGVLPGARPALVIGAHYDTAPTVKGRFVGANDGAAGTAAVIELSRALQAARLPAGHREIRFVLFDGEEEARPTNDFYRDALKGSKAYVAAHPGETSAMVLLDFIAGRGLRLPREGSSTRALWNEVRAAARDVGVGSVFPARDQTVIIDDHTPFLRAKVPAVDLIDWSYRWTHTPQDTYDKLSERSMDAVGETIALLAERQAAPPS